MLSSWRTRRLSARWLPMATITIMKTMVFSTRAPSRSPPRHQHLDEGAETEEPGDDRDPGHRPGAAAPALLVVRERLSPRELLDHGQPVTLLEVLAGGGRRGEEEQDDSQERHVTPR